MTGCGLFPCPQFARPAATYTYEKYTLSAEDGDVPANIKARQELARDAGGFKKTTMSLRLKTCN